MTAIMGKTIGLKQLGQKVYIHVEGLDEKLQNCVGVVENAFECIIYGPSGNGKSNFTAIFLKALILAMRCKCEYVSYEEGHTATIQETFLNRHNMYEELGNVVLITDHYTFTELQAKMRKRQSAKIWVIDSLQAARFTEEQCASLKREFVLSRKKKIIIYVSWAEGKEPKGAAAKAVEYNANIKLRVEGLIVFPKTRFYKDGIGNKRYVIFEPGARDYWGDQYENIIKGYTKKGKPTKPKSKSKEKSKSKSQENPISNEIPVTDTGTEPVATTG